MESGSSEALKIKRRSRNAQSSLFHPTFQSICLSVKRFTTAGSGWGASKPAHVLLARGPGMGNPWTSLRISVSLKILPSSLQHFEDGALSAILGTPGNGTPGPVVNQAVGNSISLGPGALRLIQRTQLLEAVKSESTSSQCIYIKRKTHTKKFTFLSLYTYFEGCWWYQKKAFCIETKTTIHQGC